MLPAAREIASRVGYRIGRIPLLLVGLIVLLLLFLRHPAGLLHANFWGEDGWVWYPDAYQLGLQCLVQPHTGYLQTISRLGALLAQLVPVLWAPTVFTVIALVVQALPPILLLSRRFDGLWPQYWSRLLFALVYIALPNSFEPFGNLTNSQWYLAILAFLIVVGATPRGVFGRIADSLGLIIAGLSGPFCLMLVPIAVWTWWRDRCADRLWRLVLTLAAAAIQCAMLVRTMGQTRPDGHLGASLVTLADLVTLKVTYSLLLGSHVLAQLAHSAFWSGDPVAVVIAALTLAVLILAWWQGGSLYRRFALFGCLVTAAALASPVVAGSPAWVALAIPNGSQRYFVIPMLVLAAAFFALAAARSLWLSRAGVVLCLALSIGTIGDFPYPHLRQTDFDQAARAFAAAPPGAQIAFPILPTGAAPMVLVKK